MLRFTIVIIGFASLVSTGCDRTQCQEVCDDFEDCAVDLLDVGDCRNECEDRADTDTAYSNDLNECDACLDDEDGCPANGSDCEAVCVTVVTGANG